VFEMPSVISPIAVGPIPDSRFQIPEETAISLKLASASYFSSRQKKTGGTKRFRRRIDHLFSLVTFQCHYL
jgi:hypothetical protein